MPTLRTVLMPNRIKAIVQALYERHVDLAEGTDDQRRTLQTMIDEQVCFELGPEWGAKKADSGRPRSKDSVACVFGGVLYSADCFNGGTRKPSVPSVLEEIPGQVFDPVQPTNHLGVGGAPVPMPEPRIPDPGSRVPSPELDALRAENAALREARDNALAAVAHLDAQLQAQGHPSYDAMMAMIAAADAAFKGAQRTKKKTALDATTGAHLTWRFLIEHYSQAQLVEDARERGQG